MKMSVGEKATLDITPDFGYGAQVVPLATPPRPSLADTHTCRLRRCQTADSMASLRVPAALGTVLADPERHDQVYAAAVQPICPGAALVTPCNARACAGTPPRRVRAA